MSSLQMWIATELASSRVEMLSPLSLPPSIVIILCDIDLFMGHGLNPPGRNLPLLLKCWHDYVL